MTLRPAALSRCSCFFTRLPNFEADHRSLTFCLWSHLSSIPRSSFPASGPFPPYSGLRAVGLPIALGFASSLLGGTRSQTRGSSTTPTKGPDGSWYRNLIRPAGTPPNAAFPIVWTALYAGMGWASHLVVRAMDSAVTPGAM